MKQKERKLDKIHCSVCGLYTHHQIVWSFEKKEEEEELGIWWNTKYEVLQCRGCDMVALRTESSFSEDEFPKITILPKAEWRMLKPKYFNDASPTIKRIYSETIEAYNVGLPILCAAGIRTTIAAVCRDKEIIKKDLKEEIDALNEKGIITTQFTEALHENRLLGNDALHENSIFGDDELKAAIQLIETLIETIYETESKASLLKKRRLLKKK